MKVYEVLIEYSTSKLDRLFSYVYDGEINLLCRVIVPFAHKDICGVVINIIDFQGNELDYKNKTGVELKKIKKVIDKTPLLNEELNDKEIELERIQVIETKNDGPWVEENERRSLNEQNEQLVSGFFFNKMFYERPDLFEELENGKDIEELLFQMIDEELNDDIYDTEYMN